MPSAVTYHVTFALPACKVNKTENKLGQLQRQGHNYVNGMTGLRACLLCQALYTGY